MNDNINVLLKLFETLKESSDKNEEATQQLIVQQLDLVGHIKYLPIEDLRQALKDHAKESSSDIDLCSETVTTTSGDLMAEIKKVGSKVSKMILVVVVAFTLVTGLYVIIRSVADRDLQKKVDVTLTEEHRAITDEVIKEMRKEVLKMHNENEAKGK